MIVLAIAGLILAVILLAVPALQRSQRNNARQTDGTHLAGIVSDYEGNHGGKAPSPLNDCGTAAGTQTALYAPASENWSQLQACKVIVGAPTAVQIPATNHTTFVVGTNITCVNGQSASTSDINNFAVFWRPEPDNSDISCVAG